MTSLTRGGCRCKGGEGRPWLYEKNYQLYTPLSITFFFIADGQLSSKKSFQVVKHYPECLAAKVIALVVQGSEYTPQYSDPWTTNATTFTAT